MELETREVTTAREAAQINAPTIERQMKGGIILSDKPDRKPANLPECVEWIDNDRAGHATYRARRVNKPYIDRLKDMGAINLVQHAACCHLGVVFRASIAASLGRVATARYDDEKGDSVPPEVIAFHNAQWVGLLDETLTEYERGEMVRVVVHDVPLRDVLMGTCGVRQMRAIMLMDRMARYFEIAKCIS